jgi:chromate reductase
MKLVGIVGSLRRDSYNRRLMDAAAGLLPPGVELEVWDGLRDIPAFDDSDIAPVPVASLRDAIAGADGVLIATPEYNGSIPGQLKNALDWVSVPFEHNVLRNKPVAVIGTSTGMFGAVWAQAELRKVLGLIGARVLDRDTPVGLAEMTLADGLDAEYAEAVTASIADLVALVEARLAA